MEYGRVRAQYSGAEDERDFVDRQAGAQWSSLLFFVPFGRRLQAVQLIYETVLSDLNINIAMLKDKEPGQYKYSIKTSQRQAFMQVFNLHAVNGRVDQKGLKAIFERVGYFISEDHFNDICLRAFKLNEKISFEEFMEMFKVRDSPHGLTDIKNAFKLLAGEQDEFIPLELIHQIYRKAGIQKERVDDLLSVLSDFVDTKAKTFNYRQFLSQLS